MSDYRRWFVAGGSFFFTVVVNGRRRLFDDARTVSLVGDVFREVRLCLISLSDRLTPTNIASAEKLSGTA